jgi:hypothetical protein
VKPESNIYTRFSTGKTRSFVALPKDKKKNNPKTTSARFRKTRTAGEKEKRKSQVTSNYGKLNLQKRPLSE